MLIPAAIDVATPARNAKRGVWVAIATAKIGASVDIEPSISPTSAGCTRCKTKSSRVIPRVYRPGRHVGRRQATPTGDVRQPSHDDLHDVAVGHDVRSPDALAVETRRLAPHERTGALDAELMGDLVGNPGDPRAD